MAVGLALQTHAIMADASPAASLQNFDMSMSKSVPPPVVAIEYQGIRYEQVMNGIRQGLPHRTGYLSATEASSGRSLWIAQIYEVQCDPTLEQDAQEVYFSRMTLTDDRQQLLIENEAGQRFLVRLSDHVVTSWPDDQHP